VSYDISLIKQRELTSFHVSIQLVDWRQGLETKGVRSFSPQNSIRLALIDLRTLSNCNFCSLFFLSLFATTFNDDPLCTAALSPVSLGYPRRVSEKNDLKNLLSLSLPLSLSFLSIPFPCPSEVSPSPVRCRPQLFSILNSLHCLEVDLNRVTETRTTSPSPSSSELVGCQSLPFLSEGKAALRPLLLALFTFE